MPAHTGGFLGDLIESGRPQLFRNLNLDNDPDSGRSLGSHGQRTGHTAIDSGEPLIWNIVFRSDADAFTHDDLAEHVLQANLIGTITRNLIAVQRERTLKQRLQKQLDELASVQRALLPSTLPKIPGLRLATSYLTSEEAGGDYYDFYPLPHNRWGILIADVAGHGAAAAAIMAMLHAILHGYSDEEPSPAGIVKYANRRLVESSIEGKFITAFFGVYDPAKSELSYVRAGHNPPHLKRADGSLLTIDGGATLPLGVVDPIEVESETLHLHSGDTLVLYTDGITEAFNSDRELFGGAAIRRSSR
jgi:phosphoserine phosphatase RsbU/P